VTGIFFEDFSAHARMDSRMEPRHATARRGDGFLGGSPSDSIGLVSNEGQYSIADELLIVLRSTESDENCGRL
jgi:hypothetical protein